MTRPGRQLLRHGRNFLISLVFATCLYLHFKQSLVGFGHSLAEHHSFRQHQTAISVYYLLKDGLTLDYPTPVQGFPWAIPFEFPTYQWIVAVLVKLMHTAIAPTGRAVSLTFFYLSLVPMYALLRPLVRDRFLRLLPLAVVLVDPIYLYWSRTFLIESTGLFFSLAFLWGLAVLQRTSRRTTFGLTVAAGALAALTKITTFTVYLVPAAAMVLWSAWCGRRLRGVLRPLVRDALAVGLPLACAAAWTAHADALKLQHPIAASLASKALTAWNFGTWEQRTTQAVWDGIADNSVVAKHLGGLVLQHLSAESFTLACAVVSAVLWHRVRRWQVLLLLTTFLAGPIVFTNLYWRHDYYHYANSLFLAGALGLSIVALLESDRALVRWVAGLVVLPLALTSLFADYASGPYHEVQLTDHHPYTDLAGAVRAHTDQDDVLLVCNGDWDATLPYVVERRALMAREPLPLYGKAMQREIAALEKSPYRIRGMVLAGDCDAGLVAERVKQFGLLPTPVFDASGVRLFATR